MWNFMVVSQPANGEIVWVRMLYVQYPFQAIWDSSTATFAVPGLTPIPWYFITKWRPL